MNQPQSTTRLAVIDVNQLEAAWTLRLRALREHPESFGQPYEDAAVLSMEQVKGIYDTFWNFLDNRTFGAFAANGEIVGMTGVARYYVDKMRHRMDIWGVYVAPEFRGLGVATQLLEAALNHARNIDGVLQVQLQVVTSNDAAIRTYERAGFSRWGRMPRADLVNGVEYDNDFMVLMLDAS